MPKPPKPRYTLHEAADILATELGAEVDVTELLQWAGEQAINLQTHLRGVEAYTLATSHDGSEAFYRVTRDMDGELTCVDTGKEDALVNGFFSLKLTPELAHQLASYQELDYRHLHYLDDMWVCDVQPFCGHIPGNYWPLRLHEFLVPHGQLARLREALTSSLPTKDELNTKTRKTYLRVIAGLCKRAGIDWTQRGQAQVIVRAVEQTGESVNEDTVRKILQELIDELDAAP
ncbi:MAG: hypothetical protein MRY81_15795 [Donghicola eburneus]|nr:hypothetical protein [Donghicola eburneus]MBY8964303.1 hypothetical protein [Algiphilus acroporae]MCI5041133.1 hypothetical protein [Donghicola eburneus]